MATESAARRELCVKRLQELDGGVVCPSAGQGKCAVGSLVQGLWVLSLSLWMLYPCRLCNPFPRSPTSSLPFGHLTIVSHQASIVIISKTVVANTEQVYTFVLYSMN